jgi:hypothetical protein
MPLAHHDRHSVMRIRPIVTLVLLLSAGCSRYEWKNELDVPGLCDKQAKRNPGSITPRAPLDSQPTNDRLFGRVLMQGSEQPLGGARILLTNEGTRRTANSDSLGRFALDSILPGRYLIEVWSMAMHSVHESTYVAASERATLAVSLAPFPTDGPCSGFFAVRVRKPWWKLW